MNSYGIAIGVVEVPKLTHTRFRCPVFVVAGFHGPPPTPWTTQMVARPAFQTALARTKHSSTAVRLCPLWTTSRKMSKVRVLSLTGLNRLSLCIGSRTVPLALLDASERDVRRPSFARSRNEKPT